MRVNYITASFVSSSLITPYVHFFRHNHFCIGWRVYVPTSLEVWMGNAKRAPCLVSLSLQVATGEDESDPLNPLFIGPEKLLSLYSENNSGNFCLSYLLTNRDYSGLLGLAWEGKAGESDSLRQQCTGITDALTQTSSIRGFYFSFDSIMWPWKRVRGV